MSDKIINIKVTVRTEAGRSETVETPPEMKVEEFINQLLEFLDFSRTDKRGYRIRWTLEDRNTSRALDSEKTLEEEFVKDGHVLYLHARSTVALHVFVPEAGSQARELPSELASGEFIRDVVREFRLGNEKRWRVYDKDLGRILDREKTLQDNGVENGHHLYLQQDSSFWERVRKAVLGMFQRMADATNKQKGTAAVVGLAVLAILAIWWFGNQPKVALILSPTEVSLEALQSQKFTAIVNGTEDKAVAWSATPGVGSISPEGVYTAPQTIQEPTTVSVTATRAADPKGSASATVRLNPALPAALGVEVNPKNVSLGLSEETVFTATVTGTNPGVAWSLNPGTGTISKDGKYVAPPSIGIEQTVTVTATSLADATKAATATVTLLPVTVSLNPTNAELKASGRITFKAEVTGSSDKSVRWSSPGPGTISQTGVYVAPVSVSPGRTVRINAISNADPTKTATATVTLSATGVTPTGPGRSGPTGTGTSTPTGTGTSTSTGTGTSTPTGTGTSTSTGPGTSTPTGTGTSTSTGPGTSTPTGPGTSTPAGTGTSTPTGPATSTPKPPAALTLDRPSVTLGISEEYQFAASFNSGAQSPLKWSLLGPGKISNKGLYVAPSSIPTEEHAKVTATSASDSSKYATADVTLRPLTISVTPAAVDAKPGQAIHFQAKVTNSSKLEVKWSLAGPGRISDRGEYVAPKWIDTEQLVRLTATSRADSARSAVVAITLKPYAGRTAGMLTLTWPGQVRENAVFTIEGRSAPVTGDLLPGIPVKIELDNKKDFEVREAPNTSNGWSRVTVRSKTGRSSVLRISWEVDR